LSSSVNLFTSTLLICVIYGELGASPTFLNANSYWRNSGVEIYPTE
jgi:hypothetical protein